MNEEVLDEEDDVIIGFSLHFRGRQWRWRGRPFWSPPENRNDRKTTKGKNSEAKYSIDKTVEQWHSGSAEWIRR